MFNIMMSTNLGHLDQSFDFISISPTRIRRLEQSTMECPRCGSTNTKFCYYNNYSKTQPRYFCKACKRHWTKGGTLRNVPTGGGGSAARKINKRQNKKKINKAPAATPIAAASHATIDIITAEMQIPASLPFGVSHEFSYDQSSNGPLLLDNLGNFNVGFGNLMDIASTGLNLDLSQQHISFSSLTSFENNNNPISSLSTTSTSADTYNYAERFNATSTAAAFVPDQPWPNCWNLADMDTLVSSHDQLNWDESPAPMV